MASDDSKERRSAESFQLGRLERDLATEWERLRITLSSIGDAVISTDAEGRVVFLNRVAEALTGWTQAEAEGCPLSDVFRIVNEYTREAAENPADQALRRGVVVGLANHTVLIARDGSERPIDDSAAPMVDDAGSPIGAVLVFRDVTERRRLEETQARLAAIVDSSNDAIISKTLDGIIRTWNTAAERLFGYTAEEAVGQSITLIIPADRLDEEREILVRLSRGERIEHYETVRRAKDGRLIDISLTISPMYDAQGRIIGASKVARDVSERKQTDEALRDAMEALRRTDRRKDEFLALLAHELRNPLAPLRNGLQVIRLATDPDLVAKSRDIMERQLFHMVRLIDDLLDISRISLNKMELQRSRVLLADVINSAVETARPVIQEAGHRLMVSQPPEPIELDADLTRLAQVFGNLLSNSARYTRGRGQIWLTAVREGRQVTVTVRDTGVGIPAAALPDIFEMFSQVDRSLERSAGGLGLGLALVKRLVEMHGGTVQAESPGEGQGSTFTVRLPALEDRAELSAGTAEGEPETTASKRRILVVDDNEDSATSMEMILKLVGNEVRTARDGHEAVEIAEQYRPQVILMDIGMPHLNGYDATKRIREQPWGHDVAIIALTGWGQEGDRDKSRDAGCDGHLVKPVDLAALEKLLAELDRGTEEGGER